MEKFRLTILGCGSATPTTRHNPTSQILNLREKLYMIDCAEGTQLQMRKYKQNFNRLNHIFISHLHGDHCFGLMGLISTLGLLERTAQLHIHAHQQLEVLLKPQLDFFCPQLPYEVVFHPIEPKKNKVIFEDRTVTVSSIPLKHRMDCCGFLFEEKPRPNHIRREKIEEYQIPLYLINRIKNGEDFETEEGKIIPNEELTYPATPPRSYAYCSDTVYKEDIIPIIKNVKLLFHEATFIEEDQLKAKKRFHSTAKEAATIAQKAEVEQLVIGHFSARYKEDHVFLEEAKRIFSSTALANEGKVFDL
jgi:ribonuclease Z